jgi:acetylornithine deacetylase/succinyl-diaminopimelate desuccinylase family protein
MTKVPTPDTAADAVDAVLAARRDELIDLVHDLVSIDSQIPPYADERAIIAFLRDRLASEPLGCTSVLSLDPNRPNLITRMAGSGGGCSLLLSGHVDTKPVGDGRNLWVTEPLVPSVREDKIYGLGTSDMKAAIAAMVYAAKALKEAGVRLRGDVVLAFTADEEAGSNFGARFVASKAECRADACLIGEPSGWQLDWQGLHIACRGLCCFRIRVHGTQMHSSLADRVPSKNASTQMAKLLLRVADEIPLEYEPHPLGAVPVINAGVIVSGGVAFGVYPGLAEFACDVRTLPGMAENTVKEAIRTWVKSVREEDPALQVDIEFEPGLDWIPGTEIDADHALVLALRAASERVLGQCPPLSVFPGGTDSPWFESAGIPSVPSFGPGILTYCHGPNEFVSIRSVEQAARIYAHTVLGFCG